LFGRLRRWTCDRGRDLAHLSVGFLPRQILCPHLQMIHLAVVTGAHVADVLRSQPIIAADNGPEEQKFLCLVGTCTRSLPEVRDVPSIWKIGWSSRVIPKIRLLSGADSKTLVS
jgi:hypothetical protein